MEKKKTHRKNEQSDVCSVLLFISWTDSVLGVNLKKEFVILRRIINTGNAEMITKESRPHDWKRQSGKGWMAIAAAVSLSTWSLFSIFLNESNFSFSHLKMLDAIAFTHILNCATLNWILQTILACYLICMVCDTTWWIFWKSNRKKYCERLCYIALMKLTWTSRDYVKKE